MDTPKSAFSLPSRLSQFLVYITRDVLSKLTNLQYMLINMMEAPVLAFVLSLFIKYYPQGTGKTGEYTFSDNVNIPQYLFISVIVSLFLGLTVSAEEIIRDQKILNREKYLNLSKGSYLMSKISIMFTISAIQSLSFVLIGNSILEVKDMMIPFWIVLFTTSCFANVLGLNISASFNSAKVIYIIIPILIIPQLLFSGVIVRFDRLSPAIASQSSVPLLGNVMASRWAYEALAVYQFRNNDYDKIFYTDNQVLKNCNWKKDFWVKELKGRVASIRKELTREKKSDDFVKNIELLRSELANEQKQLNGFNCTQLERFSPEKIDTIALNDADRCLDELFIHYRDAYNDANREREKKVAELTSTDEKRDAFMKMQKENKNEALEDFLTNKNDIAKIVEYEGKLVQKSNPIYLVPKANSLMDAHFYAPSKPVFGKQVTTISANVAVIWLMSFVLAIILFFDGLRKLFNASSRFFSKMYYRFFRKYAEAAP